ncbi:hypothetical protein [Parafrankia discariae]|uniref:hypothetical protein n=1 Tax=Parafrankia discariae TaxID=365528 RepID=UPI00037DD8C9|nr:hypothetical protein [Parafrankia discariae]
MAGKALAVAGAGKDAIRGAHHGAHAATSDIAGRWIRHLPPWIAAAALPGLAALCHLLWSAPTTLPWAVCAMTLTTTGLTALTWKLSHTRAAFARALTTAMMFAPLAWVTAATITGITRPAIYVWVLGAFAGCFAQNIRLGVHATGDTGGPVDHLRGWWATKAGKAGLEGSTMRTLEVGEDRGIAAVELAEGQTVGDLVRARDTIAALAGVPPTGVRIAPDSEDASKALVTLVRRDLLNVVTRWEGPTHIGGLPTDPHLLGIYEDGEPLELTLTAVAQTADRPGQNAQHVGIGGKNGAGKSGPALIVAADWLCRREGLVIVIDTVKQKQTFGPVADLLTLFVTDEARALDLLTAIRDRLGPAMGNYLGDRGYKDWAPGRGIPAVLLIVEEATALPAEHKRIIVDLLRQGRSWGLNVKVSGQRWTYDGMPTSARAEIGPALQFGCADGDAGYLLEDLVEQGADPAAWGNRHPGRLYARLPNIDDARALTPARTLCVEPIDLHRRARPHYIHVEMPDFYKEALGDVWTNRPIWPKGGVTAEAATASTPTDTTEETKPAMPTTVVTVTTSDDDPAEPAAGTVEADEQFDRAAYYKGEPDEDPDIQPGVDDQVPGGASFSLAPPPPRPRASAEQVEAEVRELFAAWPAGTRFGPTDLAEALPDHAARHRSTMSRLLDRLAREGVVTDNGDGTYRTAPAS